MNVSSPPLALTTSFSVVPMSSANGAGSMRSKRTRAPLAVTVKTSAPLPPLTSAVSVPAPPSIRSVSSPGFQIMRSLPASPNIWSSPSPPVSTSLPAAAEQEVGAALAEQRVVAGLAEQLVAARAAGERVVAGAAEQVRAPAARHWLRSSVIVSLPPWPKTWISDVFATVACRPGSATAPPLTSSVPAALRLVDERVVEVVAEHGQRRRGGEKEAVMAMMVLALSSGWKKKRSPVRARASHGSRRTKWASRGTRWGCGQPS